MNPKPLPQPVWLDDPSGLPFLAGELNRHKQIAVDTESNSLHAYREQVCLIQFSTPGADYLVDTLAITDLSPLAAIFSNPEIEKIFHAAEYDLICLQRDFGFKFANIFDTMQAGRILGYKSIGLNAMLQEKFGITLDKRYQKADWGRRPLPPAMLDYARLDTHYLVDLRDLLYEELHEKDRWVIARDDFNRACTVNGARPNRTVIPTWERIAGNLDLAPRTLTILNELCECREKFAERLDRPVFKTIHDKQLISIAEAAPGSVEEMKACGLSQAQIERFGASFLLAVRRGQKAPLVERTPNERPKDAVLVRIDRLKTWRKRVAHQLGVESDIVLPRSYVHIIAERNPRSVNDLGKILADSPWRLETYAKDILRAIGVR